LRVAVGTLQVVLGEFNPELSTVCVNAFERQSLEADKSDLRGEEESGSFRS
jgi:hypothetical protein